MLPAKCCIINILIFGQFFEDLNFSGNSQNLSTLKQLYGNLEMRGWIKGSTTR